MMRKHFIEMMGNGDDDGEGEKMMVAQSQSAAAASATSAQSAAAGLDSNMPVDGLLRFDDKRFLVKHERFFKHCKNLMLNDGSGDSRNCPLGFHNVQRLNNL